MSLPGLGVPADRLLGLAGRFLRFDADFALVDVVDLL